MVAVEPKIARARLRRLLLPRTTRGAWLAGALGLLLGLAAVLQVRAVTSDSTLVGARQGDLVRILDDLNGRSTRLESEVRDLVQRRDQLLSGDTAAAQQEAVLRVQALGILAGTIPAQGAGVTLTLDDRSGGLTAALVLDAVQELRDAGAEAMDVRGGDGSSVRIVASTWFSDSAAGLIVDGQLLRSPLAMHAIGDAPTMVAALGIPGGVLDSMKAASIGATVASRPLVLITALHGLPPDQYARPTS